MVVVRAATPEDWQVMRDMRLAALRESPSAFASTAEREAAYDEPRWRAWTHVSGAGVMFFAEVAGLPEPAGLAGVYLDGGEAHVVAMWVRPAARGQKVGKALIEATAGWVRSRGFGALYLWVTESNAAARTLYERCGFSDTGERQPLPSDPALPEIKMSRPLLPAGPATLHQKVPHQRNAPSPRTTPAPRPAPPRMKKRCRARRALSVTAKA